MRNLKKKKKCYLLSLTTLSYGETLWASELARENAAGDKRVGE